MPALVRLPPIVVDLLVIIGIALIERALSHLERS